MTSLAGNVYADNATITCTNSTITANEAWCIGSNSSGQINPAWIIKDYLEIREKYQKTPISYKSKTKLYAGLNTFANYNSYLPTYNVLVGSDVYTVSQYQKVLFFDTLSIYEIELVENIYKVFYDNKTYYQKDSTITYNPSYPYIIGVNSILSISNNNGGTNEFNVQSVTVTCTTPTVQGKYPLYPDTMVNLTATIVDSNKNYNKTVVWTSSDPSIATVDQNGQVTGVSLGQVTITAKCDGVSGTIVLEVIEEIQTEKLESIYITDNKGGTSLTIKGSAEGIEYHGGQYSNGTDVTVTVNLNPSTAPYASIEWTFEASLAGRQYVFDKTQQKEIIENQTSVVIHVVSGSGKSPDPFKISCKVTSLTGEVFSATFQMCHAAETCLLPTSLVMLADGTEKMAKDLTMDDEILSFNHITGKFEAAKISFNVFVDYQWFDVITLTFENGKVIELATGHGFFNITTNRYEIYYGHEFEAHIGEVFATVEYVDGEFVIAPSKLVNVVVEKRYTQKVSPVSEYNINCIADGILTIPDDIEGMFDAFVFNNDLTIDMEAFQEDIMNYGLITYEEVADVVPKYLFDVVNFQYFKIFIAKGYLTVDKVNHWIEAYLPYIIEQHNLDFDFENRVPLTNELLGLE